MWDDAQRFLDSLIGQYGIARVLLAPFAVIGLLAGAGLFTGGAVSLLATALSIFVAVVIISALTLQLRAARELLEERARVVNLYTDRFARNLESYAYMIEQWDESVVITKDGDTTLEKWVTVQVAEEDLYSVWTWVYRSGIHKTGSVPDSQRRRFRFEARSFDEERRLGARYDVTSRWEGDSILLFIHFEQPASAGDTVRIWMRWEWPGYYKSLLEGDTETVEWIMYRPNKYIVTVMVFDRACKLHESFNITPLRGCIAPVQARAPDGTITIKAEYKDVPLGVKVGFRLDGRVLRNYRF